MDLIKLVEPEQDKTQAEAIASEFLEWLNKENDRMLRCLRKDKDDRYVNENRGYCRSFVKFTQILKAHGVENENNQ